MIIRKTVGKKTRNPSFPWGASPPTGPGIPVIETRTNWLSGITEWLVFLGQKIFEGLHIAL